MGQDQVSGGVSVLCWLAAPVAMFYGNLQISVIRSKSVLKSSSVKNHFERTMFILFKYPWITEVPRAKRKFKQALGLAESGTLFWINMLSSQVHLNHLQDIEWIQYNKENKDSYVYWPCPWTLCPWWDRRSRRSKRASDTKLGPT